MPGAQPATRGRSVVARAPLALNRGFRRTLEAESKSPRTVEAYTDAVRILALYCEAHGKPLLAGQLRREYIQDFIADQDRLLVMTLLPGTAWHGSDALWGSASLLHP